MKVMMDYSIENADDLPTTVSPSTMEPSTTMNSTTMDSTTMEPVTDGENSQKMGFSLTLALALSFLFK